MNTTSHAALASLNSLSRKALADLVTSMVKRWGTKAQRSTKKTDLLKGNREAVVALALAVAGRAQKKRVLHVEAMGQAACTLDDAVAPTLAELLATPMTLENVRPTCRACVAELGLEDEATLAALAAEEEAAAAAEAALAVKATHAPRKAAKRTSGNGTRARSTFTVLATEPTPIFVDFKGARWEGTLLPSGEVTVDGTTYTTPSKALKVLAGVSWTPDGWRWWRYMDAGDVCTLGCLRSDQKYAKRMKTA